LELAGLHHSRYWVSADIRDTSVFISVKSLPCEFTYLSRSPHFRVLTLLLRS
jgi:hypothetical protein